MKKVLLSLFVAIFLFSCNDNDVVKPQGEADSVFKLKSHIGTIEELYISSSNRLYAVDYTTGARFELNHDKPNSVAMASTSGAVYQIYIPGNPNPLRSTILTTGYTTEIASGTNWFATEAMTALSGYVYIIDNGTLYQVNTSSHAVTAFSDYPAGWSGTEAMAAVGGNLYAVQAGTLWRVTVSNGDVMPFSDYPTGWEGTEAMAAYGGYIYAVQGGTLWQVNLSNGDVAPFSAYPNGWAGTIAMTAKDGFLFAVQGGALWKVSISTGSVSQLGGDSWSGTTAMTARL